LQPTPRIGWQNFQWALRVKRDAYFFGLHFRAGVKEIHSLNA